MHKHFCVSLHLVRQRLLVPCANVFCWQRTLVTSRGIVVWCVGRWTYRGIVVLWLLLSLGVVSYGGCWLQLCVVVSS